MSDSVSGAPAPRRTKPPRPLTVDERLTLLRHLPQVDGILDDVDPEMYATYAARRVRYPHTFTATWSASSCGEYLTGRITVRNSAGVVGTIRLTTVLYAYDVAGVFQRWTEGGYLDNPAPLLAAGGGVEHYASTYCDDAESTFLGEETGLRSYLADVIASAVYQLGASSTPDAAQFPDHAEILASRAYRETEVFLPDGTIMSLMSGGNVPLALSVFWFRSWLSGAGWAARLQRTSRKVGGQSGPLRALNNALRCAARAAPPAGQVWGAVPAIRDAREHLFALRRMAQEPGAHQEARTALQELLRSLPGALVDTMAVPQAVWDAVRALLPPDTTVLQQRVGSDMAPDFPKIPDSVTPANLLDRAVYCAEYIETLVCGVVVVVIPVAAWDTAPPSGFAVRVDVPDVRAIGEVGFVRWVWCPCADLAAAAEAVAGPTSPARPLLQTLGLRLAYLRGRAQ